MTRYFAKSALLPSGWAENVVITTDERGWIVSVEASQSQNGAIMLAGTILPGMPNIHSHAFQRAMAGLAEYAQEDESSFWTWRQVMYDFLGKLTPEDQEAIAAQLYVEMLKAGYTAVCEFHYLHNDIDGTPYADPATTSYGVIHAARTTGIGLTHIPVLYMNGGVDGRKPDDGQKRFINTPETILDLVSSLRSEFTDNPDIHLGFAPHSLRGVSIDVMGEAIDVVRRIDPAMPIHIHTAEQKREVDDCVAFYGQGPVAEILDRLPVNAHWCFIHATHMNDAETRNLARSGAVVSLCPSTEGSLGDGLFNLGPYIRYGGRFGIGSDSHISISPVEELRWLEYGQRLAHKKRLIAVDDRDSHNGAFLYKRALAGGAQATGRALGRLEAGYRGDFIVLDDNHPLLYGRAEDGLLDSFVFAGNVPLVRDVIVGGRRVITQGRHEHENEIAAAYRRVVDRILTQTA